MSQKFLKIGVIGLGGRVDGFLKWAMAEEVDDFQVVAVTDLNKEATEKKFKESPNVYAQDARFYTDADEMLDNEELDGVMIGTTANFHVEMAIKVMKRHIPLYLEKPVAIDWESLNRLYDAVKEYNPRGVVAFPLRYSLMAKQAKEIIDAGILGTLEQVQAYQDVSYGRVYQHTQHIWKEISGDLWLEKASHDLDLITYLVGEQPKEVCAMTTKGLFPQKFPNAAPYAAKKCKECEFRMTCPESDHTVKRIYRDTVIGEYCCYNIEDSQQDCGSILEMFGNGVQAMYSQNFFARFHAGRRGGRYYGYKGTLEFDINNKELIIMHHTFNKIERIKFDGILDPHIGGDEVISRQWAALLRGEDVEPTFLAGINSIAIGLSAMDSDRERKYVEVPWYK